MAVQQVANDFILDKLSVRFNRIATSNEILDFNFKFENKAPQCALTLFQKAQESVEVDQTTNTPRLVTVSPVNTDQLGAIPPVGMNYGPGKNLEFHAQVAFSSFNRQSTMANKRTGFFPLIVQVVTQNPEVAGHSYQAYVYLDFDLASAKTRLIQQKIVTP